MDPIETLLQELRAALHCERVVVYSPARCADIVCPPVSGADAKPIDALTRQVLGPVAQHLRSAQVPTRSWIERGGPPLPHRALVSALASQGRVYGFVAALRSIDRAPFNAAETRLLQAAVPRVEQLLDARDTPSSFLRRPDLEAEIARRAASHEAVSVVYANLDQLHGINDIAGFDAGDAVISAVSRLWQERLAPQSPVAGRLSGDRYAAVLFGMDLQQARQWAEETRDAVSRLQIAGCRSQVTASFGVASLTEANQFDRALAGAETACRAAKDRGRNRVEVYESSDVSMIRRHDAVREAQIVSEALDTDRFALHAQPIVALRAPPGGAHYEILLRLRDRRNQYLSIGGYLKAAERYQLLERLDHWVIEQTLRALGPHAQALHRNGTTFAINITGQSLSQAGFADFVADAMARHGVPGQMLAFEFTETAAVDNIAASSRFIERMAALGARIALDDFGTGLSSLVHLKGLAIDQIKIDGEFVSDVLTNARSEALVRALVQIANELGLQTVAEYVETEAVAARLWHLGVQYAQGHLYGRARPLEEVLAARQDAPRGAIAGQRHRG